MIPSFEYRKFGGFTYHVLTDPLTIKTSLISVKDFQISLNERADEREEGMLHGVSIEPLLVNRNGFELMDGYTRYTVLKRYQQKKVYAYIGSIA